VSRNVSSRTNTKRNEVRCKTKTRSRL